MEFCAGCRGRARKRAGRSLLLAPPTGTEDSNPLSFMTSAQVDTPLGFLTVSLRNCFFKMFMLNIHLDNCHVMYWQKLVLLQVLIREMV